MLRKVEIADLANMDSGRTVPCVEGVLSAVYEVKKMPSSRGGTWTVQNATLKSGPDDITVKFVDYPDQSQKKRKLVRICCGESDRGISGVSVKDEEWNEKMYRKLVVREPAQVTVIAENGSTLADKRKEEPKKESVPQPQYPAAQAPEAGRQAARSAGNGQDGSQVERIVALWWTCFDHMHKAAENTPAVAARPENEVVNFLRTCTTTIFMEAKGRGLEKAVSQEYIDRLFGRGGPSYGNVVKEMEKSLEKMASEATAVFATQGSDDPVGDPSTYRITTESEKYSGMAVADISDEDLTTSVIEHVRRNVKSHFADVLRAELRKRFPQK